MGSVLRLCNGLLSMYVDGGGGGTYNIWSIYCWKEMVFTVNEFVHIQWVFDVYKYTIGNVYCVQYIMRTSASLFILFRRGGGGAKKLRIAFFSKKPTGWLKKMCDLRRLVQKCNFFCATLLYGVFFIIFRKFVFFWYFNVTKKIREPFSLSKWIVQNNKNVQINCFYNIVGTRWYVLQPL